MFRHSISFLLMQFWLKYSDWWLIDYKIVLIKWLTTYSVLFDITKFYIIGFL